ncbi:MAG: S8 family serine peptidase [Melioribacteraceae bacterium]|jgi:serine protease AprX|nr:S8 family serine peptidase [Melioribacteraceae bacterium]
MKTLGEDFITFEDLPINQKNIESIKKSGAKIGWKLKWFNAVSAILTDEQYQNIIKYDFVEKIEKVIKLNSKKDITEETNLGKVVNTDKTDYNLNYGASLTQNELSDIPIIHDYGFSGEGVLIGILDAGFAWEAHPALQTRKVLAERDFVNGDKNTDDGDASHGTAVFSLIGGFDEGNIIGPAYNAQYVLAKTEYVYTETHTEEDNYVAAMQWMDSIGVDITTTSLGYSEFDDGEGDYTYADMDGKTTIVTQASELAFSRGILTIASAGNFDRDFPNWKHISAPADGFNTIAVGAVSSYGNLASFSLIGPSSDGRIKPEIVAQGVNCYHATAYSNGYGIGSGTSYSAPISAGIVAQLLSAFPYLTNKQMRDIVIKACDSTENPNNQYGYGLLSAKSALEYPNVKLPNADIGEQVSSINRIFIDSSGIVKDSVFILFTLNSQENISRQKMLSLENSIYSAPYYGAIGDTITFWFEYLNSNTSVVRSPKVESYKLVIGQTDVTLGMEDVDNNPISSNFELSQNYPNPFNPLTRFSLTVPETDFITISIYNTLGEKVRTLVSRRLGSGNYNFTWDGSNDFGGKVSSGVYLYAAFSKSNFTSKKMIYLK